MAKENKTQATKDDPVAFLNKVEPEQKKTDCLRISRMMEEITGAGPVLWGPAIIGFGDMRYESASGRSGDWFCVGFSPRKQNITLYLMGGFGGIDELLGRLGKHKTSKGCLYINKLSDVDEKVLLQLIKHSYDKVKNGMKYG